MTNRALGKIAALLLAATAFVAPAATAHAQGSSTADGLPAGNQQSGSNAVDLIDSLGAPQQFDAIVRIGNCSGSIIALPDSKDTDPALILTNGHCYNLKMRDGDVVTNMPVREKAYLFTGPNPRRVGTLPVNKALYATMTDSDIAIYRVGMSYRDIYRYYRTVPRVLSDVAPTVGDNLHVTSGYWKRTWDCTFDGIADKVQESGWTWEGVTRMVGPSCKTQPGSSGSPVLNDAGKIVAVNNAGNFDGAACRNNNACENNDGNITVIPGARYATRTDQVPGCFSGSEVNMAKPECTLPGGAAYSGHALQLN
ncbi:S1 family peptidase [Corynebacterium aquilae]|uniref:S1 family peptidase n=1 Tax=Corynebacterium aquilae TaxID=203263 RepID=UPI000952B937|nr:serine protease [Corynebacterium aquilae]